MKHNLKYKQLHHALIIVLYASMYIKYFLSISFIAKGIITGYKPIDVIVNFSFATIYSFH